MKEEQKHLDHILSIINKSLEEEIETFDELEFKYRRDPERFGVAYKIACNNLKVLRNGVTKPYFARIDFEADNQNKTEKIYIGKYGIYDKETEPIVVDWRAPISSLYYDSEVGKASYICPEGIIEGQLHLKRQFEIEDGKLLNYHDVDIVSNDELLQKYLHTNNDMRLKNIVSTIQSEQNSAIRKPININTIIQGVAGSGKTTIALHRIAYLVYNYRNKIKNNQYMVIGPNDVFLKYIESVLPDLDVSDVNQQTYEKFAKEVIDEPIKIKNSSKKLTSYLAGKINNDIPKFKSSDEFRIMIDLFIDEYFESIISSGLVIKNFEVIDKETLYKIFTNALNQSPNLNIATEKFVLLVNNYIEERESNLISKLNEYSLQQSAKLTSKQELDKLRKNINEIRSEIEKGCKQTTRKYISKYNLTPTKLYKLFINKIENYDLSDYKFIQELKKETSESIKEGNYDFEDLAPLMHIRYRLGLDKNLSNYRHVVIDEAQDLGKFNFYILKECLPNATFSIYGDIAQSIYDYRSIDSWDEVKEILGNSEILSFKKSYRTTDEIMSVANCVAESLNLDSSELSIRHGEPVSFNKVEKENIPSYVKDKIQKFKEKGYKTVAVISKYPTQSNYINDDLSFEGLIVPNVDEKTDITNINNDVLTISNYLSKGLEFDAVIINGADEEIYSSKNSSDMKMLYVALTRALHEMDVVYSKELSKPLVNALNKNDKKEIIVELKKIPPKRETKEIKSSVKNIVVTTEAIEKSIQVNQSKKKPLPKAILKKTPYRIEIVGNKKDSKFHSEEKSKVKKYTGINSYKDKI